MAEKVARMQRSGMRGTAIPEKSRKFRRSAATPDCGALRLHPGYLSSSRRGSS